MSVRVSINGFGRIGRNVLRAIVEAGRKDIEVVGINDLGPVETNAHLLRFDTVHGRFPGEVTVKGDTISLGANRMRLERVEPPHVLAWSSEDGNWVWTFVLEEHNGTTRLISRNRFRLPTLAARIGMLPMEPGSLLMERRMLRGIKERAERLASARPHESSREADSRVGG